MCKACPHTNLIYVYVYVGYKNIKYVNIFSILDIYFSINFFFLPFLCLHIFLFENKSYNANKTLNKQQFET